MLPVLLVISSRAGAGGEEHLRQTLNVTGFKTYFAVSLSAAVTIAEQFQFDAALVDFEGLAVEATDFVKRFRDHVSHIPVVTILHSADEELLLQLLEAGANQVLAQAPSPRVIAAQLHRWIDVFRARQTDESGPVQVGPLRLDPRRASVTVDGMDVRLTASEFELLHLLALSAGDLVHRTMINRSLSSISAVDGSRSTDMHVSRIRRKLKAAGGKTLELSTIHGQGYLLRLSPEKAPDLPQIEWLGEQGTLEPVVDPSSYHRDLGSSDG